MSCRFLPSGTLALAGAIASFATFSTMAATAPASPPSVAEVRVVVDLSDRELSVRSGEEVMATYAVAIGTDEHQTPTGSFSIRRIVWNPSWTPPDEEWARDREPTPPGDPKNPMGRVKVFFAEPDYYIHGTNDEGSLGRAASHGCLRMANDDVIALATTLMENGGEPRPASWFRRIVNAVRNTEEVRLSNPVAIEIQS
jgi:lipoprotein-anchoring transpeptidase ErfK/SrfK